VYSETRGYIQGRRTKSNTSLIGVSPLRYRSSIRIMVRGEDKLSGGPHGLPGHRPKVRKTSRHSEPLQQGATLPIVRPAIRLPKDLIEKMPSAPTTPVSPRKDPLPSKLVEPMHTKKVPKSVASMVRRFELEATSDTKTRAGFKNEGYRSRGGSGSSTPRPMTPHGDTTEDAKQDTQDDLEMPLTEVLENVSYEDTTGTPISSRASSMSDTRSPRDSPSNEVPDTANVRPEDTKIREDSSFKSTVDINKEMPEKIDAPVTGDGSKKTGVSTRGKKSAVSSSVGGIKRNSIQTRPGTDGSHGSSLSAPHGNRAKPHTSTSSSKHVTCDLTHANGPKLDGTVTKKSSTVIGSLAMKDGTNQSNLHRKGVQYSKSNDSNKSSTQTIRDTSAPKTLQPPDKNLSVVKKKSTEKRGAVKESHKKPSLVDRDRGSAGNSDKKESVIKVSADRKQSMVQERKPSRTQVKSIDKNTGPTKTDENKEKQDSNNKSTIQHSKKDEKKQGVEKNASLAKKSVQPRPIEKASSSVSLVRKKFERKIESIEHAGEKVKEKKHTQPVPKVTISQNLFLKGDANAKKKDEDDDDTNECDSQKDKGCVDSNLPDENSLVNSSHNQSECLPSDISDSACVESIQELDSAHSDGCVPSVVTDTSDIFSVPSPDRKVDCRHSSDLSKSILTQPVIHPDSHVNGSEIDSSHIKYQSPHSSEVPMCADSISTRCPISMNSSNPTNAEPVTLLSRMQTIPNLNIDDVAPNEIDLCDRVPDDLDMCDRTTDEMDMGDRLPDRLGPTQLEHELPESPAYRSPLLSDSEPEDHVSSRQHVLEAFVGGNEEPSLRNKLLSNLVNKRSESDGIVTLDRPRPEMPVRRCESIDNAMDLVNMERDVHPTVHFPQNIKTVTPATIMKGPEDYTAGLQETVYLRAHYFGNPEPRVAWYKGGRRLNHVDRIKIRTYPGESTLVIRDLRADDSGKYEIQIENEVGNDSCSASLCVEGPPEPPGGRPYITTIDRDTLRLTLAWYGSTFDGGSMLTGYIVEMSSWPITTDSGQPEPTDWTIVTSKCHSTSYIVKNLDPDREYIFRVKAQNIHGPSAPGKVCEPVSFMKSDDDFDEHETNNESEDEDFDAPFEHRHVTLEEGSIFKDKFDIYEELGRGRFGVVFKVKDKDTREVFAAKFVRCRKQEEREKCKEEINIMNGLDHSRLLQLAAAYENPREVIMIMEFIGGGELFEKVVADDFTLTEHDCVLFMRQICMAIGYMHQKDIVHLDLKPENILCKSKKSHQIKIIDFGLTRKLKPGEDVRILFGTPEFVSPEVISYEPVSASSDMWSVGVVCYVLLSGLSPFMGDSDVETFSNITGLSYDFDDEAFEHISEDAKDFIHKMLVKDQRKRLKALECLKHPWLNQRESDKRTWKEINTDKLKSFLMRRRWQKAAHAIRALGRFTSLGFRQDSKDSASSIALSTQSADF